MKRSSGSTEPLKVLLKLIKTGVDQFKLVTHLAWWHDKLVRDYETYRTNFWETLQFYKINYRFPYIFSLNIFFHALKPSPSCVFAILWKFIGVFSYGKQGKWVLSFTEFTCSVSLEIWFICGDVRKFTGKSKENRSKVLKI